MATEKPFVLVVDDERSICDLLKDALTGHGYVCEAVNAAEEALSRLDQRQFDLVLLDIKMPGVSGMDLLTLIKQSHPAISVIMVTAVNDSDVTAEAMRRGASGYVLKPFSLEEVRTKIASTLSGQDVDGNPVGVERDQDDRRDAFRAHRDAAARSYIGTIRGGGTQEQQRHG